MKPYEKRVAAGHFWPLTDTSSCAAHVRYWPKAEGLEGGFFNSLNSTAITAFDINGNVLGSVTNNQIGIEFLGLVANDGSSLISGLLFSLVGPELAGFTIDDVRFGIAGQVVVPGPGTVPLPAALPLFTTGLGALGLLGWRRKKRAAALAV